MTGQRPCGVHSVGARGNLPSLKPEASTLAEARGFQESATHLGPRPDTSVMGKKTEKCALESGVGRPGVTSEHHLLPEGT